MFCIRFRRIAYHPEINFGHQAETNCRWQERIWPDKAAVLRSQPDKYLVMRRLTGTNPVDRLKPQLEKIRLRYPDQGPEEEASAPSPGVSVRPVSSEPSGTGDLLTQGA